MPVTIALEQDEALVLFEALASKRLAATEPAERNALWALEALLERQLAAPFASNYEEQLQAARASIVARMGT